MNTNKASVQSETLTDGSIVFNVVKDGEQIAHPASQAQAEALCALHNANPSELIEHIKTLRIELANVLNHYKAVNSDYSTALGYKRAFETTEHVISARAAIAKAKGVL
jgi:hypothetical protein